MPIDYANETRSKEDRIEYIKKTLLSLDSKPRLLNQSAIARKLGVSQTTIAEDLEDAKEQIRENYDLQKLDVSDDFKAWLVE